MYREAAADPKRDDCAALEVAEEDGAGMKPTPVVVGGAALPSNGGAGAEALWRGAAAEEVSGGGGGMEPAENDAEPCVGLSGGGGGGALKLPVFSSLMGKGWFDISKNEFFLCCLTRGVI